MNWSTVVDRFRFIYCQHDSTIQALYYISTREKTQGVLEHSVLSRFSDCLSWAPQADVFTECGTAGLEYKSGQWLGSALKVTVYFTSMCPDLKSVYFRILFYLWRYSGNIAPTAHLYSVFCVTRWVVLRKQFYFSTTFQWLSRGKTPRWWVCEYK